jgi:dTDP-4-dehydrorhamnose 3,5-epimerase
MKLVPTPFAGVVVVETEFNRDHRGSFGRLYCERELATILGQRHIVQINHSRTASVGAIRGMHFQRSPTAEMKFVRCLAGRVLDVAVDLRKDSPTQFQWHAQELSPNNGQMLVIPEGCAHGFQVLEPESELLYLHTAPYSPDHEGGIRHDDARIGIKWLLPVTDLSQRDRGFPLIDETFQGLSA